MLEGLASEALLPGYVLFGVSALAALLISLLLCRYAIARQLIPNIVEARSSHTKPTSRAGGVAVMLAFLTSAAGFLLLSGQLISVFGLLLLLSAGAMFLGLADDIWSPSPVFKLAGQALLAVLATFFIGQVNTLPVPLLGVVPLGMFGFLITVIWIVSFTNVFNFMDGLNGIAGSCAAMALLATALACALSQQLELAVISVVGVAALAGFLFYNFPKGKIFLGDSGSHGIGFFLAVLAVSAGGIENSTGSIDAVFVPIIFLPFILDVTVTLVDRAIRGATLYQAHKEHIYQRMHQNGLSHGKVALIYIGLCAVSAGVAFVTLYLPAGLKFLGPLMLICFFTAAAMAYLDRQAPADTKMSGRAGD